RGGSRPARRRSRAASVAAVRAPPGVGAGGRPDAAGGLVARPRRARGCVGRGEGDDRPDRRGARQYGGPGGGAARLGEAAGALFRVRFARLRLERPQPAELPYTVARRPETHPAQPWLAAVAVAVGSGLVLFAALLGLWLLVALTLAGTGAASLLLRP